MWIVNYLHTFHKKHSLDNSVVKTTKPVWLPAVIQNTFQSRMSSPKAITPFTFTRISLKPTTLAPITITKLSLEHNPSTRTLFQRGNFSLIRHHCCSRKCVELYCYTPNLDMWQNIIISIIFGQIAVEYDGNVLYSQRVVLSQENRGCNCYIRHQISHWICQVYF